MSCLSAAKQIAAMIAALAGVDMIVFTGGIGEHDMVVRAKICDRLSWVGLRLDPIHINRYKRFEKKTSRC